MKYYPIVTESIVSHNVLRNENAYLEQYLQLTNSETSSINANRITKNNNI